jgi:hypothetical protein
MVHEVEVIGALEGDSRCLGNLDRGIESGQACAKWVSHKPSNWGRRSEGDSRTGRRLKPAICWRRDILRRERTCDWPKVQRWRRKSEI